MTSTPESRAQALRNAITLEAYRSYVANDAGDGHTAFRQFLETTFQPAVMELVRTMASEGSLPRIEGGEGHEIDIVLHWNCVVDGRFGEDHHSTIHLQRVAEALCSAWLFDDGYEAEKKIEASVDFDEATSAAYEATMSKIVSGAQNKRFPDRNHYCAIEDIRYALRLEAWKPILVRYDHASKQMIELQPIGPKPLRHLEIDFPTGELIVADWIRIEEFSDSFPPTDFTQPSTNSLIGKELKTEEFLREHGILHIAVSDFSPSVFQEGADVVVGLADYDDPHTGRFQDLGSICTDLWWTTIIDRQTLHRRLVGQGMPETKAQQAIDAYLEEDHVVKLVVAPGRHHVYWSGDHDKFASEFHSDDFDVPNGVQPFFVITDRELTLSAKNVAFHFPSAP